MTHIIAIKVLETKLIVGAEQFIPPAKIGNLKDPDKIAAKVEAHNATWLSEVGMTSPLLTAVTKVAFGVLGEEGTMNIEGTPSDLRDLLASKPGSDFVFIGDHPTSDFRLLRKDIPPGILGGKLQVFNPFRELDPVLEIDAYSPVLGPLQGGNPIETIFNVYQAVAGTTFSYYPEA